MTTTSHEVGRLVDSLVCHAVQRTVTGPVAVCGAGKIAVLVPGRFDPDADAARTDCAVLLR